MTPNFWGKDRKIRPLIEINPLCIGYTARPLNVRVSEHTNKSSCLSKAHSSFKCGSDINKSSFSILCKGSSVFDLRVKEAFFISNLKPSLNTKYESIKQNSAS